MKTYSFFNGKLSEGIELVDDQRLGKVVYLGEAGRGRRYEKVGLDRYNPAETDGGRVYDAYAKKITLPARDGKPEKVFFTLEKPHGDSQQVLVRVCAGKGYTRRGNGGWRTVEGDPTDLIYGWGADGDAGRIGTWRDGLVQMAPGDVLRVQPSGGGTAYALWFDQSQELRTTTWKDYENLTALEQATNTAETTYAYHSMPAFSWRNGQITEGIRVQSGAAGLVVGLGEKGRGRRWTEVPVFGMNPERLTETAVAVLDADKGIHGLTTSDHAEEGAFLVHISTQAGYTRGSNGRIQAWKGGDLRLVAQGVGAHGDAGNVCDWTDNLVVMREGDVIFAKPEFGRVTVPWAVFVKNGKLHTEKWADWKFADALRDPDFYIAKGTAPWGHVPQEWVGRVVTVTPADTQYGYEETGELITISPLVLNMGWDGRDRSDRTFNSGRWIKLEAEKHVTRLEGAAADKRTQVKAQAEALVAKLRETQELSYFRYARIDFGRLFEDAHRFDTMETEGYSGIEGWIQRAETELAKFDEKRAEAIDLECRVNAGAILVDFEAWNRRGGMTNNGSGWVVTPTGERRSHDTDDIARYKSDGTLTWRLVSEDELALRWSCGHMRNVAANSTFEVVKLPVNGLTAAQRTTVAEIEESIGVPNGFGLDTEAKAEAEAYEEEILSAVRQAMVKAPWFQSVPSDLEMAQVASEDGQDVTDDVRANLDRLHNTRGAKTIRVARRFGKLVGVDKNVSGGWLLFMTYHKYGHMNMNVRWLNSLEAEALAAMLEWEVFRNLPAISQEGLESERGVTAQYAFADDEY